MASMDLGASAAGISVLKRGGNAIDAAVATASALGVTIPFVAGPGGGGFMVVYLARTHQVVTIDGRETCPQACTLTMFTDPKTGQPLGYDYASDQPLATGVPSMVATWAAALRRYGRHGLAADLQPAIDIADRGFRVNADFQQLTESELPELQAYPASREQRRRLHEHDQLLRRQRPGRPGLRVPAQQRDDGLRLRAEGARGL